tara:strand:+ start:339 stop:1034 length:696 start_codon:yes stop_codon:yes gene_type:complete
MNIKILLLILLILILIVFKNKENFIINENKWLNYRLGDCIKNYNNLRDKTIKNFPNTLGSKFVHKIRSLNLKNENHQDRLNVLNSIIKKEKLKYIIPTDKDVVLHLRLGDILSKYNSNNFNFTRKNWGTDIIKLESILQKIKDKHKVNKFYIVYGAHKKNINVKLNKKFLEKIKQLCKKYFTEVILRNTDPDSDFIFMCSAKIFIKSGGGFSRYISNIVKMNGGEIYDCAN